MNEQPRILGGRYQLGRVIGRGGMALVSQARDLRLGRDVAVKELRIDLAGDSTFQARFRREAQAAAGLNHPAIVSVYDTGEEMDAEGKVGVPYIVMELVEGRTLRDILREGRPILPRRALEFTVGVLEALAYSHKAGIVHRDIKPANVMLTSTGAIKVMDFGIARAVSDTSSTMTQTAAVIGTAQYLSPEQARGETVDARSDIYSAGCLMYELLVGRPPFTGDSPVSVAYQHVREQPVAPSTLDAEVTAPMDAVVLKALAKDPEDRYATAGEMRDDVQRILGGHRVQATLPPPVPPLMAAAPAAAAEPTQVLAAEPAAPPPGVSTTATMAPVEAPRKSRAALWWTLAVIALLAIGLVAGGLLLQRQNETRVRQVAVPSGLFGQPQLVAEGIVKDARLVPRVVQVESTDVSTVNRVVNVSPPSGTTVDENSTVQLTVNVGPKKFTVPGGLEGKTEAEARKLLTDAGFSAGSIKTVDAQDEPATAKKGTVVSVAPVAGTQAAASDTITLSLATGKARLPYLIGMTKEAATAAAKDAGFTKLTFTEQSTADATQVGTVVGTRPLATQLHDKDANVEVVIGKAAPSPTPSSTPTSALPSPTGSSPTPTP